MQGESSSTGTSTTADPSASQDPAEEEELKERVAGASNYDSE